MQSLIFLSDFGKYSLDRVLGLVFFWCGGTEKEIEEWQLILSLGLHVGFQ